MFPLLRALAVTAGRGAYRRSAPFYFAVLIAAGIAFGGHGMDAADLTSLMQRSPVLRITLWGLWLVGSGPAAGAIFSEPRLLFLRSLPVSRPRILAAHLLLLLIAELPWLVLFSRGAGLLYGVAVTAAAAALHCLWVARPLARRRVDVLLLGALLLSAIVAAAPVPWLLPLAVACLALALPQAYIAAPERVSHTRLSFVSPQLPPQLALALAYLALLARGQRVLLLRCAALCLLPAGIAYLAITNNAVTSLESQSTLALGTLSVPLLLSLCSLAAVLLHREVQLAWLLSVAGQTGARRVRAVLLALSLLAIGLALPAGGLLAYGLHLSTRGTLRLLGLELLLAASLSAVAQGILRATQRSTAKDSDRLLLSLLGVIPLGILLCWLLHEAVVLAWLVFGLFLSERATAELEPAGRYARLRREREQRSGDEL